MAIKMTAWSGEKVCPNRVRYIDKLRQELLEDRTQEEAHFHEVMGKLRRFNSIFKITPQKVIHVQARKAFILDFYMKRPKIAIEIDGGYHTSAEQRIKDACRTKIMTSRKRLVIRFTNDEVMEDVFACVRAVIKKVKSRRAGKKVLNGIKFGFVRMKKEIPEFHALLFPGKHVQEKITVREKVDLLPMVYGFSSKNKPKYAKRLVFEEVNSLLADGDYNACNELLETVDLHRLSIEIMLAFITVTAIAWKDLPYREVFYDRVKKILVDSQGPIKTRLLLSRLKYYKGDQDG